MRKISISAAILLLSTSAVFAESGSIKEAFSKGTTSGDLTVYTESIDKDTAADTGVTIGSIGVTYTTDTFKGFSATAGFRGNTEIAEENTGDYALANSASVTEANIKYTNDKATVILGRQAIDLEWLGDYNDAAVAVLNYVPDTSIVLGYSNAKAEIDSDTNDNFTKIGVDGGYVLDATYSGITNTSLTGYYYDITDTVTVLGATASYSADMFGITGKYATGDVDNSTNDDEIYAISGSLNIEGVSLGLGYISTNNKGGAGTISTYGDNINPFDNGTNVYSSDSSTTYGSIGYTIADLSLSAVYGKVDYGTSEDTELNLIADYAITSELAANITYVDEDVQGTGSDVKEVMASLTYSF